MTSFSAGPVWGDSGLLLGLPDCVLKTLGDSRSRCWSGLGPQYCLVSSGFALRLPGSLKSLVVLGVPGLGISHLLFFVTRLFVLVFVSLLVTEQLFWMP